MNPFEDYIRELRDIRSSGAGVKETSYYAPLSNLLNEIGKTLKPKVRCIINIKNRGAGIPDGGLFTADQFQKASETEPFPGQIPARGAIEVKGTGDDVWLTAESGQVARYLGRYRQVLVTNYRDFILVSRDSYGSLVKLETYRLADSESAFWVATTQPPKLAEAHGDRFIEYMKRVMLHAAPLDAPEDVAWFLASYARDARARIEEADLPALATVRAAFEEALGIKFKGTKGEHFFRSTMVQTLFYGVFSAWVLWSKQYRPSDTSVHFDWRTAAWSLRVPMIKALFEQVATPSRLGSLGLVEVLDWAAVVLNRVDRASFFAKFEEGHAVQYFYEPFLKAFDPVLRKELGVWYTPPEIVQYMVARVDTVLREELGLPDGLADSRVYVLDPCCGTGAYLVEVLKRIAATLREKGGDALDSADVKRAAMDRAFGFEILPAPFVVAHLQLGLLLQSLGAPLSETKNERVGVYLTNALTGWEPSTEQVKKQIEQLELSFPELKQEHDAANEVKRDKPILVILGNPPYNAFAGISSSEEKGLVEPYKEGLISEWGIKKFNLDDLYVRFFRLAERRIAEQTGKGIVCYISNFSYLGDPSFVVMRQRFLAEFDKLWFDCMNGDSRETGKLTPEGKPDPSVFSTEYNREGIRVGTDVCLMMRGTEQATQPTVRFRHFWGVTKRVDLLESLKVKDFDDQYQLAKPDKINRFSFRLSDVAVYYLAWPKLVDLCNHEPFNGPIERRGNSLIVFASELEKLVLLKAYLDANKSDDEIRFIAPSFMKSSGEFKAEKARALLRSNVRYNPSKIVRYPFKPFDVRLAYLDADIQPLFSRPSPELLEQRFPGNKFLIIRETSVTNPASPPFYFSSLVCDYHLLVVEAKHIPIRLRPMAARKDKKDAKQIDFFTANKASGDTPIANLSPAARTYLANLGIKNPDADAETAGLIWMHALAIGYSPTYLAENADGIRQDWPRVPLPDSKKALLDSADLGRQVAALLDTERPVPGVTSGTIRPELKSIAVISRVGGGTLNPNPDSGDLAITTGWGHVGKDGVTMPGKGKVVKREYMPDELAAIEGRAKALGLTAEQTIQHLGETTCDIYLNNSAYWKNIPARVWDYTIGGYQVIKKWLSYREHDLLGRSLTTDEAREVMNIARCIATILLLEPALDANYTKAKQSCYTWPTLETKA
ncbi:MAG: N-6 DNA methylase [Candidatus Tectomicrobia bacterium]|nr:N-6 DNA methylase [Candidatus Tectomicrobia bacterium]